MTTRCTRCPEPAAAVMRFEYATARVWIDDLDGIVDPGSGYRLCAGHASGMTAPVGWDLADRRSPMMSLFSVDVA